MGPINTPPQPVAWRERNAAPIASKQVGLEVIGRTDSQGLPVIYWGSNHAECFKLAEADGYQL